MSPIRTITGHYIGDEEIQKIAKKVVATILSELSEE